MDYLLTGKLAVDGKSSELRIQENNDLETTDKNNGILFVYDVSNVESFSVVKAQLERMPEQSRTFSSLEAVPQAVPDGVDGCDNPGTPATLAGNKYDTSTRKPMILVGNKRDKSTRNVTFDEGLELASKFGLPFWETSAEDGTNVEVAFFEIIRGMRKHDKGDALYANASRNCSECIIS